jgi:hypothetical protein
MVAYQICSEGGIQQVNTLLVYGILIPITFSRISVGCLYIPVNKASRTAPLTSDRNIVLRYPIVARPARKV